MTLREHDGVKENLNPQQQAQRSTLRCSCVCVAIFCLTLVAVGLAGGTAAYFLHLAPNTSTQNVTNVQDTGSASDQTRIGNYLERFQKLQVPALLDRNNNNLAQIPDPSQDDGEKGEMIFTDTGLWQN